MILFIIVAFLDVPVVSTAAESGVLHALHHRLLKKRKKKENVRMCVWRGGVQERGMQKKHEVKLNKRRHGDILKSATQFDHSAHQLT